MSRSANLNEDGKATGSENVAVPAEALLTSGNADRFEERASESRGHVESAPSVVSETPAVVPAPAAVVVESAHSEFSVAGGVLAENEYGLVDPNAAPADDSSEEESWEDEEEA